MATSNPSSTSPPAAKRTKRAIEDDLICPITHELPFDPVMAEDSYVYERSAIQEYFKSATEATIKSPMTNEMIGTRLLPALRTKNTIETAVENGFITGDLAIKWNNKVEEEKKMQDLLKKAESGDVRSMEKIGCRYYHGTEGFKKDQKIAFQWFQKARQAGSVVALGRSGYMLFHGQGIAKNTLAGVTYITSAAEKGCGYSAAWLGFRFVSGIDGFPENSKEGIKWLKKSLEECAVEAFAVDTKQAVEEKLAELHWKLL